MSKPKHKKHQDVYLRAIDSATGKDVWKARLLVGSQGTPISYVASDGKQYVVISVNGGRHFARAGRLSGRLCHVNVEGRAVFGPPPDP